MKRQRRMYLARAAMTLLLALLTTVGAWADNNFTANADGSYTIWNVDGWNEFCDALQDNDTYNRFSGKTVKLGANITVTSMAGSDYHDFCGTFDGQGHTITIDSSNGAYALFSHVSNGTPVGGSAEVPATIKNLHVTGTINASDKYAAGFISRMWGTVNITNCVSSVTIQSSVSGDGTHGGLVASSNGKLNIEGCLYDGKLLTTNGTILCGGFVGYGTCNITNSLYAPATIDQGETEITDEGSATFVRNASPGTNCYYTRPLGTAQGKAARTVTAGTVVTVGHAGVATEYSVSGITAYKATEAHGDSYPFIDGIVYNNVLYAGIGNAVSLTLGHQDREGYTFNGYTATAGTLTSNSPSGDEGASYTLAMPDGNVTINADYTAIAPSELTATDITATTATLSWTGFQDSYKVHYRPSGTNEWQTIENIAATTTTLTDLTPMTQYEWQVQGILDNDVTGWSTVADFTTTPEPSVSVSYMDANGEEQTTMAHQLIGKENTLVPGWYVVQNSNPDGVDLAYTHNLSCFSGDVNIILADGAEMTVTGGYTQDAITISADYDLTLTIYGQRLGTGRLSLTGGEYAGGISASNASLIINGGDVTVTSNDETAIKCGTFTMNGGSLNVISNGTNDNAINVKTSFTFNGGNFSATSANAAAIEGSWLPVTLSWTRPSDSFYASSFGQVIITIAEDNVFIDEDGTLHTSEDVGDVYGKTLRPYDAPSDLASSPLATTATLSWTGNQENYNVRYHQASIVINQLIFDGFESYEDEAALEAVWTVIDLGGGENTNELGLSADAAKTGNQGFRFSSYYGSSSYDQYLISPELTKGGKLSFAYKSSYGTEDKFRVGYSITTNDLSVFTWGNEIMSDTEWQTFEQELPDNAKYFAINYIGEDQFYLYIDDIALNEIQTFDWENKTNVTSPLTLTDLTPATQYEWQVQGILDNGVTEWSPVASFTTFAEVSYLDANGEEQTIMAHQLKGDEATLAPGWYVVQDTNPDGVDLTYTHGLSCSGGDLNIILCDGAEMSMNEDKGKAISVSGNNRTLTIYGQSEGTGRLSVTGAASEGAEGAVDVSNMVIYGGIVNATSNVSDHAAIHGNVTLNGGQLNVSNDGSLALEGDLTVNGGQFKASSLVYGTVHFNGGTFSATGVEGDDVYLNWTSYSDRFYIGSINYSYHAYIADGKSFVDEDGTLYQGDITYAEDIQGKTLRPYVTILFDANTANDWMTWCSPKEWTIDDSQVAVYTIGSVADGNVILSPLNDPTVIPAYVPVLIQRKPQVTSEVVATFSHDGDPNSLDATPYSYTSLDYLPNSGAVTAKTGDAFIYGNPCTESIAVADLEAFNADTHTLYALYKGTFLRVGTTFGGIHPHRCLLAVANSALNGAATRLAISFGDNETTGISLTPNPSPKGEGNGYYSLDGRRLDSKPTRPGVYIYNGKKQVIKK